MMPPTSFLRRSRRFLRRSRSIIPPCSAVPIGEIAANKCGILKPPCAVVCAPGQTPEALGVILEHAAQLGLTVYIPNSASAPVRAAELGRTAFAYGGGLYTLPLTGVFQRDNALTAIETVNCLRRQGITVAEDAVQRGTGRCCPAVPAGSAAQAAARDDGRAHITRMGSHNWRKHCVSTRRMRI